MTITETELKRLYAKWGIPDGMTGKTTYELAQAKGWNNPVLPAFHADPEVLYSQKTKKYYIYSTTDGLRGWGGYNFNVFSSKNLTKWKDEGTILDLHTDQVKWADGNAWAPAIEEKKINGKYKYFFYFSGNAVSGGGKQIGVAIADSPTGPFTDFGKPIITTSPTGRGQQIDVDVFTDPKTGKSYLYWGNGYMAGAELNEDITSIKEETVKVLTPEGGTLRDYAYREGTYVFERNGVYYFLWSVDDTGSPNYHVAYGTATSPLGDITVAADPVILSQDPEAGIYGPAHNSVLKHPKRDEWYIVYHRINKGYLTNSPGTHREVCIDPLRFAPDGKILPVRPTQQGLSPVK
jgi:beta-xylosidase